MSVAPLRHVPKRSRRINKKVVVPLLVLVLLIVYVGLTFFFKSNEDPISLKTVCNLSHQESRELFFDKEFEYTLEMNDYFAYGETLNLYHQTYNMFEPDLFVGKTMVLVNVCDQTERVYMVERNVDGQLPMEDLPVGFYEVYVMHNLSRHRLYANSRVDESFSTIRREENTKQVRVLADAYLLENDRTEQKTFDRNYLFLEVTNVELDEEVFDIVIDPAHYNYDNGWLDVGLQANDLIEAEENYKMAIALKQEFENAGLKVMLTRSEEEGVNTYDLDGRLHRAYLSQAKYYIEVQMIGNNNSDVSGTQVIYSSYTSPRLPSAVFRHLIENTNLQSTKSSGAGNIPGVLPSGRSDEFDGRMVIRESGGKALTAATFSEKAQQENSSFALDNRRGMQTLTIEYIYITHPESAQAWTENYTKYAKETVQGYLKYFQLESEESNAD